MMYDPSERQELIKAACQRYSTGEIGKNTLFVELAKLNLNATEIKELEDEHRPRLKQSK
jgi:hypothetical protein